MKKLRWILPIMLCLLVMLSQDPFSPVVSAASDADTIEAKFPIVSKPTKDNISQVASNNKGTLIMLTYYHHYVLVSHDQGKNWAIRSLPSEDNYTVTFAGNYFYLSTQYTDGEIHNFVSKDGDSWNEYSLPEVDGVQVTTNNVQFMNGKYVLLANNGKLPNTYVYTASDGQNWSLAGKIPSEVNFVMWNGKSYTALGAGYEYYGPAKSRNQFIIYPKEPRSAEMIVFGSSDLSHWTMYSGKIKSNLNYKYVLNGEPKKSYHYSIEKYPVNGNLYLYDLLGNAFTSKDGVSFTMQPHTAKIPANEPRSDMIKLGNTYYIFTQYWSSPGIMHSKMYTSTDRATWKITKINKAINNMNVIQSGNFFFGYSFDGEVALSQNGIDWQKINPFN